MSRNEAIAPAGRFRGEDRGASVAWRGIRYAHAERFALPGPVAPPSDIVDAVRLGAACPQQVGFATPEQLGPSQSEDCLFLNIFSPGSVAKRRPVMVWFHGGAFVGGSAAMYDGGMLAETGDIVVVGVNYRLGLLGFLGVEALGIPMNLGLHDQIAALRWVRDNIAAFGGDPDHVTIAGESAGSVSVSVSLLMLSAAAGGLFHGASCRAGR
ncbi:MAG: carboxylesterase family protein [Sphingobium sp.]